MEQFIGQIYEILGAVLGGRGEDNEFKKSYTSYITH